MSNLEDISKSNRCNKFDKFGLIIILIMLITPIISVFSFNLFTGRNYINWDLYYTHDTNSVNFKEYVLGVDSVDKVIDESLNENYIYQIIELITSNTTLIEKNKNEKYVTSFVHEGMDLEIFFNNVSELGGFVNKANITLIPFRLITLNMGDDNTENLTYYNKFSLGGSKTIKDFAPLLIMNPFLSVIPLVAPADDYFYSSISGEYAHSMPSNWSDVWNNFDMYFYYSNGNQARGFSFGNKQSQNNTDTRIVNLQIENETIPTTIFDVNISGTVYPDGFRYTPKNFTSDIIQFAEPILNGVIEDTIELFGDAFGEELILFIQDLISQAIEPVVEDNIFSFSQFHGMFNHSSFKANECGWYYNLKPGFNITKYLQFNETTSFFNYTNGLKFVDCSMYLGDVKNIQDTVISLVTTNAVIILILTGTLVILNYIPSKKRKEFDSQKQLYCPN